MKKRVRYYTTLFICILNQFLTASDDCVGLTYEAHGMRSVAYINFQKRSVIANISYQEAVDDLGQLKSLLLSESGSGGYYFIKVKQNVCKTRKDLESQLNYLIRICGSTVQSIQVLWEQKEGRCTWFLQQGDQRLQICSYDLLVSDIANDMSLRLLTQNLGMIHKYDIRVSIARMLVGIRWNPRHEAVEFAMKFLPCGLSKPLTLDNLWESDVYSADNVLHFQTFLHETATRKSLERVIEDFMEDYFKLKDAGRDNIGSTCIASFLPHGLVQCLFLADEPQSQGEGAEALEHKSLTLVCDFKHGLSIQSLDYWKKYSEDKQFIFAIPGITLHFFQMKMTMRGFLTQEVDRTLTFRLYERNQEYFLGIADILRGGIVEDRDEIFYLLEQKIQFARFSYQKKFKCFMITDSVEKNGITFSLNDDVISVGALYDGSRQEHLGRLTMMDRICAGYRLKLPIQGRTGFSSVYNTLCALCRYFW